MKSPKISTETFAAGGMLYVAGVGTSHYLGKNDIEFIPLENSRTEDSKHSFEAFTNTLQEGCQTIIYPYTANPKEAFAGAATALLTALVAKKIINTLSQNSKDRKRRKPPIEI
jgi:hypothetical protein